MSMTELRTDWLIGYYALGRDKFCTKTISINNFSSEIVDSEGLYGRRRLRVIGFLSKFITQVHMAWGYNFLREERAGVANEPKMTPKFIDR